MSLCWLACPFNCVRLYWYVVHILHCTYIYRIELAEYVIGYRATAYTIVVHM